MLTKELKAAKDQIDYMTSTLKEKADEMSQKDATIAQLQDQVDNA
jgi:hypothetical protein